MPTPSKFTIQPNCPSWLLNLVSDRRLTRDEGASLAAWNDEFCRHLQSRETDEVFYVATAGDTAEAIKNFAALLRGCRTQATKLNARQVGRDYRLVYMDWCRARLCDEAALQSQQRAMSYLSEMIGASADKALLKSVISEYGYQRRV